LRSGYSKLIAAIADMHTEPSFYLAKMFVALSAQIRQHPVVQWFEPNLQACFRPCIR